MTDDSVVRALSEPEASDAAEAPGAADTPGTPGASPPDTEVTELASLPPLHRLHRRALRRSLLAGLLGRAPVPGEPSAAGSAPARALLVRRIPITRTHLAGYDKVCGYRLRDQLPATYPQVLAFPLVMQLMAAKEFPMPPFGLLQVGQTIELLRPISANEVLDLRAWTVPGSPHPHGQRVDITITATVDEVMVWRGRSVYLNRSAGIARMAAASRPANPDEPDIDRQPKPALAPTAVWRVASGVGRRYAAVSGDRDPVHTSAPAARALGFPGPVAHSSWILARCLSALEGRVPPTFTVRAEFAAPVPLPTRLAFSATASPSRSSPARSRSTSLTRPPAEAALSSGWRFAVWGLRTGSQHLTGTIVAN